MKLRQLGEDRLLAQIRPLFASDPKVIAGIGDDCAVLQAPRVGQQLLLKTDCVIEGVHFKKGTRAGDVGWKAMMRPLSDFAAMAGVPQFALITLVVPPSRDAGWIKQLFRGLEKAARKFEVRIVGGETSATRGPLALTVSVAGFVEKDRWISRAGGKAGDDLFVTGRLGGSLGGRHLRFIPRIAEARWLAAHFPLHAMMDLSDGLGADLPRLARASGLQFEVDEKALPLHRGVQPAQAINDGEDYELLFALAPRNRRALEQKWRRKFPRLLLTRVGRLTRTRARRSSRWSGYDHFA